MAENSKIAWTDHTFNPWVGCQRVSQGCVHCYAETLVTGRMGRDVWGSPLKRERTKTWGSPVKFNREAEAAGVPAKVFCASLADVFEDAPGPNEWREDLWDLIQLTPWLDWLLLTKRPENIASMLPAGWGEGWSNVWLGTSVEDDRVAERVAILRAVPAYVRFLSYEPAIGPLWRPVEQPAYAPDGWIGPSLEGIHWVIAGGESGPGHRPMEVEWAQAAKDVCDEDGVAFFFKQSSGPRPETGVDVLGGIYRDFPESAPRPKPERKHP